MFRKAITVAVGFISLPWRCQVCGRGMNTGGRCSKCGAKKPTDFQ